jgi:arsenate reductase
MKTKILFVCIHNSARSQMAEAFVNRYCSEYFEAESAGLEPGQLNQIVVEAMAEDGIDISRNATKSVQDILRAGKSYDYVVTVCDEASAESCPVFPGGGQRLHWGFSDPSQFAGIHAERLEETRNVRNAIAAKVANWCEEISGVCNAAHC